MKVYDLYDYNNVDYFLINTLNCKCITHKNYTLILYNQKTICHIISQRQNLHGNDEIYKVYLVERQKYINLLDLNLGGILRTFDGLREIKKEKYLTFKQIIERKMKNEIIKNRIELRLFENI